MFQNMVKSGLISGGHIRISAGVGAGYDIRCNPNLNCCNSISHCLGYGSMKATQWLESTYHE